MIEGSATLMLGPDIANRAAARATLHTVVEFNGPGTTAQRSATASLPDESRRRRGDTRGTGPLVHEDRRSHQLPDGSDRS